MISYLKGILNINRNPVLDLCRAIAIIAVVIHHFFINYPDAPLQFLYNQGSLGVDLFFIISGYLVGKQPLKLFLNNQKLNFKEFYIKRFFKIIPSFWFLLLGAFLLYNVFLPFPIKHFESKEFIYYLTFSQNYSNSNTLYHIWSLCVEEHFYILLPFSLLFIQLLFKGKPKYLLTFLIGTISLAYIFRYIGYQLNFETYAATHNRIDALALGVLLAFTELYPNKFFNHKNKIEGKRIGIVLLGFIILFIGLTIGFIYLSTKNDVQLIYNVIYHGLIPLGVFLILSQTLKIKFNLPSWIKLAAYFSYNWYLWHYVLVFYFIYYIDDYLISFIPYVISTFIISSIITFLVEEPFMRIRNKILIRLSK